MNEHPEGVYAELTEYDEAVWSLQRYEQCLRDLAQLNFCIRMTSKMLEMKGANDKLALRYEGLKLLRDVDNGEEN